jgi:hypothetical protein
MFRSLTSTLADELDVRVIYIGVMEGAATARHARASHAVGR